MTTCHSLKLVDDEIIGDPLDAKMFQFTGWTFEEGGRIYEFIRNEGDKEDEALEHDELLNKPEPPKGHYIARDGEERKAMPSVRPPSSEGIVISPFFSFTINIIIGIRIRIDSNFRI
jgi:hypothetical protein